MTESRLVIRDATTADRAGIEAVEAAAFGAEGELIVTLLRELERDCRASLVAEVDGRIVGHVQLNLSWLDAPTSLVQVAVLSPLAVLPERQGTGIGTVLVASALVRAEADGWPMVFLEGDPGYYASRGFRPARPLGFAAPSDRIPGDAFQVALLSSAKEWMRGRLVYCDAFWRHDCVGLRPPIED
jgi:putative acetyltransferase